MRSNTALAYSVALLVGDFFALLAAFTVAYILRVSLSHTPISAEVPAITYIKAVAALMPFFLLVFALLGLYNVRIQWQRFNELGKLMFGCLIGIMGVISYSYLANIAIFPARLVTLYGFLLAFCFVLAFRTIARAVRKALFRYGIGVAKVLLVGDTPLTTELTKLLSDTAATGYQIIGAVDCANHKPVSTKVPCYATFDEAIAALGDQLSTIIQTELYAAEGKNEAILSYAQEHHLDFRFVPGNSNLFNGKLETELFQSVPMIAVHQTALIGWGRVVKRLTDIILSSIGIVIASPIMLIIAAAIKLTDGGPVLFRQTRLTRGDHEFQLFKFRSMNLTYSGLLPEEGFAKMGRPDLAIEYRKNGNQLEHDPRVTPVGHIIRRTSLDELPQLLNVLRGDISIIGPRALVPRELATYKKRHAVLSVKSGITGLAQISGRNDISPEERRRLDIYYAQNWSFWGDLIILAKTIWVVLWRRNAK